MSTVDQTRADSTTRDIAYVAVFAAFIVALALFPAISIGVVPITLQTFAVALTAMVLGARRGTYAVLAYLALIAIGLPVAAGYTGGLGVLTGPTGGFLAAFVVQALITGRLATWATRTTGGIARFVLAGVAGLPLVYVLGTSWLMVVTGLPLGQALAAAVTPFVVIDTIKVVLAAIVAAGVLRALPTLARR